MLEITIPGTELWDEERGEFVTIATKTIVLEHSLVSLSKWESKWCKPFLSKTQKTNEETVDYIKCMTITQNVDPNLYLGLTNENIEQINAYIDAPMTATWFTEDKNTPKGREQVTAELIYYWMIALNIPFECQKWHLNRLLTLVRVCNIKNQPPKKMNRKEFAALNKSRRKPRKH